MNCLEQSSAWRTIPSVGSHISSINGFNQATDPIRQRTTRARRESQTPSSKRGRHRFISSGERITLMTNSLDGDSSTSASAVRGHSRPSLSKSFATQSGASNIPLLLSRQYGRMVSNCLRTNINTTWLSEQSGSRRQGSRPLESSR